MPNPTVIGLFAGFGLTLLIALITGVAFWEFDRRRDRILIADDETNGGEYQVLKGKMTPEGWTYRPKGSKEDQHLVPGPKSWPSRKNPHRLYAFTSKGHPLTQVNFDRNGLVVNALQPFDARWYQKLGQNVALQKALTAYDKKPGFALSKKALFIIGGVLLLGVLVAVFTQSGGQVGL